MFSTASLVRSQIEAAAWHRHYDDERDASEPEAIVWTPEGRAAWNVTLAEASLASWTAEYSKACAAIGAANTRAADLRRKGWHAEAFRAPVADAMRALNRVRASIRAAQKRLDRARAELDCHTTPFALAA